MVDKKEIDAYFIQAIEHAIKYDYSDNIPKRNLIKRIKNKLKQYRMKI